METLAFKPKRLQTSFLVISVTFLFQQTFGCQDSPVGIANSSVIPDTRFTATSHYDSRQLPKYARLNGAARGWGPKTPANSNDYLQIDLGEVFVICAVATQGCRDCNEWTTQYKISTSIDNIIWTNYRDGNTDKLFTGNTDRNTVVKNVLDVPTLVRYIRIIPTMYRSWKTLRVEAYGLRKNQSQGPGEFNVTVLSSTSVRLSWSLPLYSISRIIKGFEVYYKKTGSNESATTKDIPGNSTLTYTITGLGKYTTYTFKVLAYTEPNKKGPYSNSIDKTTEQDAPSAPTNLQAFEIAPNGSTGPQVKLTWDVPSSPNGIIQYYIVSFKQSKNPSAIYETKFVPSVLSVSFPVFGGVTYWFTVEAVTNKRGVQTTKIVKVKIYAPPSPEVKHISSITAITNNVTLWKASSKNGPIRAYQVIVVEVVDIPFFDETRLTDYEKAKEWKLHYYIAAEIKMKSETLPKIFTLGDEKVYNGYKNMKLQEGKTYNVTQRALTQDEKLVYLPGPSSLIAKGKVQETKERCNCKEQQSQLETSCLNSPYLVVSLAFNAVFVIVAILVIVYLYRKLKKELEEKNNSENRESALPKSIYENTNAVNSEDELAMSTIPNNSNFTYDSVDNTSSTVDPSCVQTEMTGHHTTTDTGGGHYQPINVRTNPKQDSRSRPIYASLHPETKTQNDQESRKESSSPSPTYQCLQENSSSPVYQSLHTNTRNRKIM